MKNLNKAWEHAIQIGLMGACLGVAAGPEVQAGLLDSLPDQVRQMVSKDVQDVIHETNAVQGYPNLETSTKWGLRMANGLPYGITGSGLGFLFGIATATGATKKDESEL